MRGFIRFRTLLWLASFAAIGLVALAYGRALVVYMRIEQEVRDLASSQVAATMTEKEGVARFLDTVQKHCDIELTRADLTIERDKQAETVTVEVKVALPIHFDLVDRTVYRPALIKATVKRLQGY